MRPPSQENVVNTEDENVPEWGFLSDEDESGEILHEGDTPRPRHGAEVNGSSHINGGVVPTHVHDRPRAAHIGAELESIGKKEAIKGRAQHAKVSEHLGTTCEFSKCTYLVLGRY